MVCYVVFVIKGYLGGEHRVSTNSTGLIGVVGVFGSAFGVATGGIVLEELFATPKGGSFKIVTTVPIDGSF